MAKFPRGPSCRSVSSASDVKRLHGSQSDCDPISAARVALAEAVARRNALAEDACAVHDMLYQQARRRRKIIEAGEDAGTFVALREEVERLRANLQRLQTAWSRQAETVSAAETRLHLLTSTCCSNAQS
jgi:site-specific recombinase